VRTGGKISVAVAFVLTLGVAVGYAYSARLMKSSSSRFITARIDRGKITSRVTASGTLSALVTVIIGTQISGRVSSIGVDFNSRVEKGQVIATLEPELFEAALDSAKASELAAQGSLARATIQAADARKKLSRAVVLRRDHLVSQAEVDSAHTLAGAARAQVQALTGQAKQAEAARKQAEINLAHTKIVSPISGVIILRNVDVGQTVAASLQSPTLFTIAEDLQKMQVDTYISEADVGKLHPDMDATFRVDAYPNKVFHGKIRQIRNAPQTAQNIVTYDAVIDVENAALELKPGMTANVSIVHKEVTNVLRVPNAALRFQPNGGEPQDEVLVEPAEESTGKPVTKTVWIPSGDAIDPVTVEVGATDGSLTEIQAKRLVVGQEVVIDMLSKSRKNAGAHNTRNPFKRYF
jgi:HlyD family secretion protein